LKIVKKKEDKYLVTLTHDELLAIVNGLAGRALIIRDIGSLLNLGNKKTQNELEKLHKTLARALSPDVWNKPV